MEKNPRHIGLLQNIYKFCDKYNLSHDYADARLIMLNGLRNICLKNRLDQRSDKTNKQYINVSVYFLNEFMCSGPLTPEQIKDVADVGTEVQFR